MTPPSPDRILQTGLGFWGSKVLLTAVRRGLFAELAKGGPLTADEISSRLGYTARNARDFYDALASMGFLTRENGRYGNAPDSDVFLDPAKDTYVGGLLEMADSRLYRFWGELDEALRTNTPQNESKSSTADHFARLYSDPASLKSFLGAMTGVSAGAAHALSESLDWSSAKTVLDAGCAEGMVPVTIARRHPHLSAIGFDLPQVGPMFLAFAKKHGVADRARFVGGDIFKEDLPKADAVVLGHMIHWSDLDGKKLMMKRGFDALPPGGRLLVYDHILDDARIENTFGLLMSMNMLIETPGGFEYTGADVQAWVREAGFAKVSVQRLVGTISVAIGVK